MYSVLLHGVCLFQEATNIDAAGNEVLGKRERRNIFVTVFEL